MQWLTTKTALRLAFIALLKQILLVTAQRFWHYNRRLTAGMQ
jgi:hypothetical protein